MHSDDHRYKLELCNQVIWRGTLICTKPIEYLPVTFSHFGALCEKQIAASQKNVLIVFPIKLKEIETQFKGSLKINKNSQRVHVLFNQFAVQKPPSKKMVKVRSKPNNEELKTI